jgi:hypothetical protein
VSGSADIAHLEQVQARTAFDAVPVRTAAGVHAITMAVLAAARARRAAAAEPPAELLTAPAGVASVVVAALAVEPASGDCEATQAVDDAAVAEADSQLTFRSSRRSHNEGRTCR